jgi:hypothetical protein
MAMHGFAHSTCPKREQNEKKTHTGLAVLDKPLDAGTKRARVGHAMDFGLCLSKRIAGIGIAPAVAE